MLNAPEKRSIAPRIFVRTRKQMQVELPLKVRRSLFVYPIPVLGTRCWSNSEVPIANSPLRRSIHLTSAHGKKLLTNKYFCDEYGHWLTNGTLDRFLDTVSKAKPVHDHP